MLKPGERAETSRNSRETRARRTREAASDVQAQRGRGSSRTWKAENEPAKGKTNNKEKSACDYSILSLSLSFFNLLETELKPLKTPQDEAETSAGV